MMDERQRELITRAGALLGDRFREDFTPGEAFAILAATVERMLGWLDYDTRLEALTMFRELLDMLEKQRSTLH